MKEIFTSVTGLKQNRTLRNLLRPEVLIIINLYCGKLKEQVSEVFVWFKTVSQGDYQTLDSKDITDTKILRIFCCSRFFQFIFNLVLHVKVNPRRESLSRYQPLCNSNYAKISHFTQLYQYVYFVFLHLFILRFCILRSKELIKLSFITYCCLGIASYMGLDCSPDLPTRGSHNQFNSSSTAS